MQSGEEVSCGFLVAGGDGSELLDDIEESFDEIALTVECEVAVTFDVTIFLRRNDHGDGARFQGLDKGICIVALVGEKRFRFDLRHQRFSFLDIVDLTTRKAERQWIAERVNDHMDFCREPAARAADRLINAPFLSAPALC